MAVPEAQFWTPAEGPPGRSSAVTLPFSLPWTPSSAVAPVAMVPFPAVSVPEKVAVTLSARPLWQGTGITAGAGGTNCRVIVVPAQSKTTDALLAPSGKTIRVLLRSNLANSPPPVVDGSLMVISATGNGDVLVA